MTDEVESLLDAHRAALVRYAYFLMAAAALFIGYALNNTRYNEISISQLPLAIALAAWVASFMYGCLHVENHFPALRWNASAATGMPPSWRRRKNPIAAPRAG
jgi:hypothetical protein